MSLDRILSFTARREDLLQKLQIAEESLLKQLLEKQNNPVSKAAITTLLVLKEEDKERYVKQQLENIAGNLAKEMTLEELEEEKVHAEALIAAFDEYTAFQNFKFTILNALVNETQAKALDVSNEIQENLDTLSRNITQASLNVSLIVAKINQRELRTINEEIQSFNEKINSHNIEVENTQKLYLRLPAIQYTHRNVAGYADKTEKEILETIKTVEKDIQALNESKDKLIETRYGAQESDHKIKSTLDAFLNQKEKLKLKIAQLSEKVKTEANKETTESFGPIKKQMADLAAQLSHVKEPLKKLEPIIDGDFSEEDQILVNEINQFIADANATLETSENFQNLQTSQVASYADLLTSAAAIIEENETYLTQEQKNFSSIEKVQSLDIKNISEKIQNLENYANDYIEKHNHTLNVLHALLEAKYFEETRQQFFDVEKHEKIHGDLEAYFWLEVSRKYKDKLRAGNKEHAYRDALLEVHPHYLYLSHVLHACKEYDDSIRFDKKKQEKSDYRKASTHDLTNINTTNVAEIKDVTLEHKYKITQEIKQIALGKKLEGQKAEIYDSDKVIDELHKKANLPATKKILTAHRDSLGQTLFHVLTLGLTKLLQVSGLWKPKSNVLIKKVKEEVETEGEGAKPKKK